MLNECGINPRVWDAVMGDDPVSPARVALAAGMCPEVLDKGLVWTPFKSLIETEESDLARECLASPLQIRAALVQWVELQKSAKDVLLALVQWDHKLAVWCACACVETTLKYMPEGEDRPGCVVRTGREWVLGRASDGDLRKAADNAGNLSNTHRSMRDFSNRASFRVAQAAWKIFYDVSGVATELWYAQAWVSDSEHLTNEIAQAIVNFPRG